MTELYYGPALKVLEKEGMVRTTAIFDPDPDSRARLGKMFAGATCLRSFEDLLRHDEIDLVIVASPPRHHADQTLQAIRSGRSVLCEKPLATSVAEATQMVQAASDERRLLAVGLVRRFFPAVRTIRDLLGRGLLGELHSFDCFEGGPFDWPVRSRSYFDRSAGGGGVLLDIGAHALDLLGWWLGAPLEVHYADDAMGGVEANCQVRLRYEGCEGRVSLSRDWWRPNRYVFRGGRGWLKWEVNEADRVQLGLDGCAYSFDLHLREGAGDEDRPGAGAATFHQAFVDQLRAVISTLRGEAAPIVSGAEALDSLRLIEHCYRNRTLLPMPWLSQAEQSSAQELFGSEP